MENCPIEILEDILFRLPFAAPLQASKVCKTWKTLVTDRFRTKMWNEVGFLISYHLCKFSDLYDVQVHHYYGEQYDHIHGDDQDHRNRMMNYYYGSGRLNAKLCREDVVVGSCNGLVCYRKHGQQYAIRNPLTGEYVFLPQIDYASLTDWRDEKSWSQIGSALLDGFGYCQSTNEYKVVRVQEGYILVYTIGSHQWRNLGIMKHSLYASSGIFANGVLHWLSVDKQKHMTFGFDLKDEKFQLLLMPSCDPNFQYQNKHLKLLGGNLCYVQCSYCCFPMSNRRSPCLEIWAYKRNNDNNMKGHDQKHDYYDDNNDSSWNWVKEFSIDIGYEYGFEPFAVTRSNQVLLWNRLHMLYGYDPKTSTLNELWDVIMDEDIRHSRIESIPHANSFLSRIECIPHKNSFVSLKDLGESGATMCNSSTT